MVVVVVVAVVVVKVIPEIVRNLLCHWSSATGGGIGRTNACLDPAAGAYGGACGVRWNGIGLGRTGWDGVDWSGHEREGAGKGGMGWDGIGWGGWDGVGWGEMG